MLSKNDLNGIMTQIKNVYGSLETPSFFFVKEAMKTRPYQRIVEQLSENFHLKEDTDPNDDVSFGYVLEQGDRRFLLRLSMVGPYGILYRLNDKADMDLLSPHSAALSGPEKSLLRILRDEGIVLFEQDTLTLPVSIRLYNTEPGQSRLYQALFIDSDVIPGISST